MEDPTNDTVALAAELTAAWLSNANTRVQVEEVSAFLKSMHETLLGLSIPAPTSAEASTAEDATEYVPAVTARKSLSNPAHIVSMIDGKPYKTLRRHLSGHGMTPEEYRARYNLRSDYPMVAPAYSEARREMAKKIGLGRKPGQTVKPKSEAAIPPKPRGRQKAAVDA